MSGAREKMEFDCNNTNIQLTNPNGVLLELVSDDLTRILTEKLPNSFTQLLYQGFWQTDGSCSKHRSLLQVQRMSGAREKMEFDCNNTNIQGDVCITSPQTLNLKL